MSGHGSKKHVGAGLQGKGSGSGAMTDATPEQVPDNMVLSNRDKAQHSKIRGQGGRRIQTDQLQDHTANQYPREATARR